MTTTQKRILIVTIILFIIGGTFFVLQEKGSNSLDTDILPETITTETQAPATEPEKVTTPVVQNEGPKEGQEYYFHTMTTTTMSKELEALVGKDNVTAVLQINRIDIKNIKQGSTIVIPVSFDTASLAPFPPQVPSLVDVPKILLFSQRVQAFAAYENGILIRWGPLSSGKQSTKTPNGLFSTNWKGKEVKSSFDDEWVLKYNFNIDNFEGIGFHQYEMPGYPASHSCLRLHLQDAIWLYDWAEQWILSGDGQTRIAHGTPVIVFGDYGFGKTAPWKLLPTDATATDINLDEITTVVAKNTETILVRQTERKTILGQ